MRTRRPRRRSKTFAEYETPNRNIWRVDAFKGMCAFFGDIYEHQLKDFHTLAEGYSTGWLITRMLYGINPLIPDQTTTDAEFYKSHTKAEVLEKLGITAEDLAAEMDLLAAAWEKWEQDHPFEPPPEEPDEEEEKEKAVTKLKEELLSASTETPPVQKTFNMELNQSEREFIQQSGFSLDMFDVDKREDSYKVAEMRWFHDRLYELRKAFAEPMAKGIARQALLNEMQMRRADDELSKTSIRSGHFWSTHETKDKIEQRYAKQWEQLEKVCPFIKAAEGRVNFIGVVSEIIEAIKQWQANGQNDLVDGLLTAFELQIELRQSKQFEVRYRPGWVAAILEAKENLWNPHYKRKITNYQCAMMDEGFREAVRKLNEKTGIRLPDLERDDEFGEYAALHMPTDAEMEIPMENIDLPDPVIPAEKKKRQSTEDGPEN